MSLDFLRPDAVATAGAGEIPVARTPMEGQARAAGARFEIRDGWNLATGYGPTPAQEAAVAIEAAGWADVSHLGKLELQAAPDQLDAIASQAGGAALKLGEAARAADAWWCRLTTTRALVICEPAGLAPLRERLGPAAAGARRASVVDVSTNFAAITVVGPLAREVLARLCAIDLRPAVAPVGALRPGSIARQPAILICEAPDRYLFLSGWATGEYLWSVVADAGRHLGARPIGVDALATLGGLGRSAAGGPAGIGSEGSSGA